MKTRSDRIFAALKEDLDAIVIMNGNGHLKDYTFKYVSGFASAPCNAVLGFPEKILRKLVTSSK